MRPMPYALTAKDMWAKSASTIMPLKDGRASYSRERKGQSWFRDSSQRRSMTMHKVHRLGSLGPPPAGVG
eukprot:1535084-Amphidinium_carterae.1